MMERVRNWFLALSPREQWLVGIAGVVALVTIAIFGVAIPLSNALKAAKADHAEAVVRHGRIKSKVELLEGGEPGRVAGITVPLDRFVGESATETGLEPEEISVEGNAVRLKIASVRPVALFEWLSRLETRGLRARNVRLTPAASGNTVAADIALEREVRK